VLLNAHTQALRTPPALLLLDEVGGAASSALPTALQHVGFGSSDPIAWFGAAEQAGVEPDTRGHTAFSTDATPTIAGPGSLFTAAIGVEPPGCFPIADEIAYVYVLGPDDERIELWSGSDGRINHVHFTSPDLPATLAWYRSFLDLEIAEAGAFFVDDILFYFEQIGDAADYAPTDEHVLGHIAFSVTDLTAWRARAGAQSVEVVSEPSTVHGFESFFVRGPDGVLIELVQAAPSPALCPD
jgi:catechol 2,3-dioxygenase-like lactoylglutathione lyase family enzyme